MLRANDYTGDGRQRGSGRTWLRTLIATLVVTACGESPVEPPVVPPAEMDPDAYLADLPGWSTVSPPLASGDAAPTGAGTDLGETVLPEVEQVNPNGGVDLLTAQSYQCTSTPYSVTDTPQRIVMYQPSSDLLWPGALIQGSAHADTNVGSVRGLSIAQRSEMEIVIPELPSGDNVRRVVPSLGTVNSARGEMIGNAVASDLETASSITFNQKTYHSESEYALGVGLSGRYLGFEASASGSTERSVAETTVTAEFYQKMYEVTVGQPQTPGAFFTPEFDGGALQAQIDLGNIGPSNPPLYVSSVVYGRMLMFSMTSTASEEKIKATLQASAENLAGSVGLSLTAEQEGILREAEISITSVGGDDQNVIDIIRTGDLGAYFTDDPALSTAAPLSYTFKTLSGEVAAVSEVTNYTVETCVPSGPGTLQFLEGTQETDAPIATPFRSYTGDFDGDGHGDMLWNHLRGNANEFFVGWGGPEGALDFSQAFQHPIADAAGWGAFDLTVIDIDGDGDDDLLWNGLGDGFNRTYGGMSAGRAFTFPPVTSHGSRPNVDVLDVLTWEVFDAVAGDFTGNGRADIAFSYTGGPIPTRQEGFLHYLASNILEISPGDGAGRFSARRRGYDNEAFVSQTEIFTSYRAARAGNVDNDIADEIVLQRLDSNHITYVLNRVGGTSFERVSGLNRGSGGWDGYELQVADIDGALGDDLVFWRAAAGTGLHRNIANGDASFDDATFQALPVDPLVDYTLQMGDLNDDGRADVVFNLLDGADNRTFIGYGMTDGTFDYPSGLQNHPAPPDQGWGGYEVQVVDVDNDGADDVIWTSLGARAVVYVALANTGN